MHNRYIYSNLVVQYVCGVCIFFICTYGGRGEVQGQKSGKVDECMYGFWLKKINIFFVFVIVKYI